MFEYEVYVDESGDFKQKNELSLVAGFAYLKQPGERFSFASKYKDILSQGIVKINQELQAKGHSLIDISKDRQSIHTTRINADSQEQGEIKEFLREWVKTSDDFRAILNKENLLIVLSYGWPADADENDFKLEGFYRHMLRSLMERTAEQLRSRHPGEEVDILFSIPTRKVYIEKDDQSIADFVNIGLNPVKAKQGFDINLSQGFLQAQEELNIRIVCRQIDYNPIFADKDDKVMRGSSWGFYLADWICAWARQNIVTRKNHPVNQIINAISVGKLEPIFVAYTKAYDHFSAMKRSGFQDPIGFLNLYESALTSANKRLSWCAGVMQAEHPFSNSRILQETIQYITITYNSADNPLFSTAIRLYELLFKLIERDNSISPSLFAELCKNLLICHQYNGDNLKSSEHFVQCFKSMQEWSPVDVLSLISIYSETYINLLAFEEAKEMLDWALSNYQAVLNSSESSGRWMQNISLDRSRNVMEKANANLALAMACAFQGQSSIDWLFHDAINTYEGLNLPSEANIARFHYIQYLLQIGDNETIARELNLYMTGGTEEIDLTESRVWESWLSRIVKDGKGDPDRMRFKFWLFEKALFHFWNTINDQQQTILLLHLYDNQNNIDIIEKIMNIDYHPIEEILLYRALLSSKDFPQTTNDCLEHLLVLAKQREGIIGIICRIGIIRIKIKAGMLENNSRNDVHFRLVKQDIRRGIIALNDEWTKIQPIGFKHSRIDDLMQIINSERWNKLNAGDISELLTYEFR